MYDSKRDGYTLVFHENEGVEIFELVAVGARIFANTSDGLYEIKASGSRKVALKDVIDGGPTTETQPVFRHFDRFKHVQRDGFETQHVADAEAYANG